MLHIIRFVLIFKHFTRYFSHNNPLDNAYFYMLFINQSPLFNQKKNTKHFVHYNFYLIFAAQKAPVAKLVDAPDLGSGVSRRVGSSPIRRTIQNPNCLNMNS